MGEPAILVEGLSKQYVLGHSYYKTLRESVMQAARAGLDLVRGRRRPAPARETVWALEDVSLRVEPGEVVGLIGGNGAGKSTLLKILARITDPTSGSAVLNGRVGSLLEVGTGFHNELSGRENIFMSGALLGMQRREIARKLAAIVDFSGVGDFIDTPVKRYSSGMKVRLGFAVAAHLEPEILLVDEVLAVGDIAFQQACIGKLGEATRSGRTVLFVSHNLAQVSRLCSRSYLLEGGRVAADGPTSEVIAAYLRSVRPGDSLRYERTAPATGVGCVDAVELYGERPGETVRLGGTLHLRIRYTVRTAAKRRVILAVQLCTPDLDPVHHFRFRDRRDDGMGELLGTREVELAVPELRLYPDRYVARVSLWDGRKNMLDDVQLELTVEHDYDFCVHKLQRQDGLVHVVGAWTRLSGPEPPSVRTEPDSRT